MLDKARLDGYLSGRVAGFKGLEDITKFEGGQSNPTFLLTAASGRYVLRRQPPGELLKSAHAVDREFRVMAALRDTDVPVPEVLHLCEDRDVIGSLFFVMRYLPGRTFWNPSLPELDADARAAVYDEMNRILAALHGIDPAAVGLADYGRPGNYYERQIARWTTQYRASETRSIPDMDQLIDWLPEHTPDTTEEASLIHGDYRLDNMIFEQDGSQALALIDWELSTLGHPFADLAYQCMQWRMPQDAAIAGLGGVNRARLGIPEESAYVEQYCRRRGIGDIPHWPFYLVFSFFRFAAILQGVQKRAEDGNASSARAFEYGALAPMLAAMAVNVIEREV